MSAKINISTSTHTPTELSTILSDYTTTPLSSSKKLFGGYSGASYLVQLTNDIRYVLKVSNGYTHANAEFMCRTAAHLESVGYRDCCLPIRKLNKSDYVYVSTKETNGVPAFLLTYVAGVQADKIIRDNPSLATTVMRGIGGGLGRMHASTSGLNKDKATSLGLRWYETDGGCCDVQDQYCDVILNKITSDKDCVNHEFVEFYKKELTELKKGMELVKSGKMEMGITHGDPFADNIMSNPTTGELVAFIDMEDVCVGPLLFDLACCAIGSCFTKASDNDEFGGRYEQVLDFDLFSALLSGYSKDRKLPSVEVEHFVAFMRLTLLCNCSWRFVKFNITEKDVPEEAKGSYLELKERIEYLREEVIETKISKMLGGL